MINSLKFKGRMVEKKQTFQSLAPKISCTPYTLGQKVANETSTTLEEANILAEELDIKDDEFRDFFLQKRLQNATKMISIRRHDRRKEVIICEYR